MGWISVSFAEKRNDRSADTFGGTNATNEHLLVLECFAECGRKAVLLWSRKERACA